MFEILKRDKFKNTFWDSTLDREKWQSENINPSNLNTTIGKKKKLRVIGNAEATLKLIDTVMY